MSRSMRRNDDAECRFDRGVAWDAPGGEPRESAPAQIAPGRRTLVASVQFKARGTPRARGPVDEVASRGVTGSGGALPYHDVIQAAFGGHDVGMIQAYIGGAAAEASDELGAEAYAIGERVAFATAPSLHTAAHEAAHVVQQRAGVVPAGGAHDERFERHADEVADLVVAGESAEAHLSLLAVQSSGSPTAIQRRAVQLRSSTKKDKKDKKAKVDLVPLIAELADAREPMLATVRSASAYLDAAIPVVDKLRDAMTVAWTTYTNAFAQHELIIARAAKQAASKQAMADKMLGFGIGLGLAVISAPFIPAKIAFKVATLIAAGSELAEVGIGHAVSKTDFARHPTPEPLKADPVAVEAKHYKALTELYRGLAITGQTATAAALVLNAITYLELQGRLLLGKVPADITAEELVKGVASLRKAESRIEFPTPEVKHLQDAVATRAWTPAAWRMEQYIWIRWIANIGWIRVRGGQDRYGDTHVLDNNTIEDYLHGAINVLGDHGVLGVSFGDFTSEEDERKAVRAAHDAWAVWEAEMNKYLA